MVPLQMYWQRTLTQCFSTCLDCNPLSPPRRARIALQAAQRSVQELSAQLADVAAAVAAAEEADAAAVAGGGKAAR